MTSQSESLANWSSEFSVNEIEIFKQDSKTIFLETDEKNHLDSQYCERSGQMIRCVVSKRLGSFSYNKGSDINSDEKAIRCARSLASFSPVLPHWKGFPGSSKTRKIEGICDDEFARVDLDYVRRLLDEVRLMLSSFARKYAIKLGVGTNQIHLTNSSGLSWEEVFTHARVNYTVFDPDTNETIIADMICATNKRDFEFQLKLREENNLIHASQKRFHPDNFTGELIIPPSIGTAFILSPLIQSLTMNERDRPYLKIPEFMTAVDDGSIDCLSGSSTLDMEGVPHKRNEIISHGDIGPSLKNLETCSVENTDPTGNANRSYSFRPIACPTNLFIQGSHKKSSNLIAETRRGVYLDQIDLVSQPMSDMVTSRNAFLIEHGNIRGKVPKVTVQIDRFDLSKLCELGGETRPINLSGDILPSQTLIAPTVKFDDLYIRM
ncbi:MAG: metallopeptidase TldD-related protein [Thaumarchaeota archaeon]|nr:metallopeptidase TldD-related protein [Nitrososphaerota archaeon]